MHYLDDFLLVGGTNTTIFKSLCEHLGFEEKESKSLDGTVVDFTGIEIDTDRMEIRLPKDKHTRALNAVNLMLQQGATDFESLRSTIGFLSFCARAVPLGRPFLRNLFNFLYILAASIKHPLARRRLSPEATRDLKWWSTFLTKWHGVKLIRQDRPSYFVYTDASGRKGIGGWWGAQAFSTRIPRRHRQKHINWKEAYAVLFALAKWGEELAGCQVTIMCDNDAIVQAINKRSIRGDAINPLQLIFLTAALYDIEVQARWLPSEENWIADALSRFKLSKLANYQLDNLFNLHRRQSGSPMSLLRRKLQHCYGTDLPHLQEIHTTVPGTNTNISAALVDIPPKQSSQPPSRHSQTSSRMHSKRTNQKQLRCISPPSKANILTTDTARTYSKTPESKECSKAHHGCLALNPLETAEKSHVPYFYPWSDPSTTTGTTTSISSLHSQSPLQPSSDQQSLHGVHGILHHIDYNSHKDPLHSQKMEFSYTSPNPRPTNMEKGQQLPLPTPTTNAALSTHSDISLQNTHSQPPVLYLTDLSARSTNHGSNPPYNEQSSILETAQKPTQATHFAEAQQTQQSKQAYQNRTSNNWEDGNQMQSSVISQQNPQRSSASKPIANYTHTWPPRHRDPSFDSLATSPVDESQSCAAAWPSSEDTRPPSWLFTLGYCEFPLLLSLVALAAFSSK